MNSEILQVLLEVRELSDDYPRVETHRYSERYCCAVCYEKIKCTEQCKLRKNILRVQELIEKLSSDNKEKKVKMTRQERISAAKTKLAQYEDAHKKYLEAQIELTEAYRSYDVGEHVHVGDSQTYGPSGPGQIVEILSDKKIKVKLDDGQIVEADLYELKRA